MRIAISRDLALIYAAAFLRSFLVGLTGVVLGIYLFRVGLSSLNIGLVLGAGLAGAAAATVVVLMLGDLIGRRRALVFLSALSAIGGIGLALTPRLSILHILAFVGMINGMGTDRSASFALEQAILPGLVSNERRTWSLAWYNVVLDTAGSLGALAAAIPLLLARHFMTPLSSAYRTVFIAYAVIGALAGLLYIPLSSAVEAKTPRLGVSPRPEISFATKKVIGKLTALFSVDALGGGLLTDALVAYWFFRRFGVAEQNLGILFFVIRLLNAASHLGAAWLARRIGLVRTMVFTHLPSSLFLMAVPFAPSFKVAVLLLLLREALVEMDVPTRQSYVAAVVQPTERTFASGATNLARNVFLGHRLVSCRSVYAKREFLDASGNGRWTQDRLRLTPVRVLSETSTTGGALVEYAKRGWSLAYRRTLLFVSSRWRVGVRAFRRALWAKPAQRCHAVARCICTKTRWDSG